MNKLQWKDAPIEYRYGYAQEHEMRAQCSDGTWTAWHPVIRMGACFEEWRRKEYPTRRSAD